MTHRGECARSSGVDVTRFHCPNLVIYEVVTDKKWTPIIGAYLLPSTLEQLLDLEGGLERFRDQDIIVL